MRKIPYTYCIVKYVHDPSVGEMLNIGVILCSPGYAFVASKFNRYYERLSKTFARFDGEHYRERILRIENSIERIQRRNSSVLFTLDAHIESVEDVVNQISPDKGLSLQFGSMMSGIATDLDEELAHIFERSVTSQYASGHRKQRDDDDVWQSYRKSLNVQKLERFLEPKVFVSESYEYKFEHAFKNERWHVLKPVNMDYAQSSSLQERATKVLGEATALGGDPELGKYYILLGEPRNQFLKNSYEKAKNLLNRIPIPKEIIEEDEADDFAEHLSSFMKVHGLINS